MALDSARRASVSAINSARMAATFSRQGPSLLAGWPFLLAWRPSFHAGLSTYHQPFSRQLLSRPSILPAGVSTSAAYSSLFPCNLSPILRLRSRRVQARKPLLTPKCHVLGVCHAISNFTPYSI
jgi:hypothetical protein